MAYYGICQGWGEKNIKNKHILYCDKILKENRYIPQLPIIDQKAYNKPKISMIVQKFI